MSDAEARSNDPSYQVQLQLLLTLQEELWLKAAHGTLRRQLNVQEPDTFTTEHTMELGKVIIASGDRPSARADGDTDDVLGVVVDGSEAYDLRIDRHAN